MRRARAYATVAFGWVGAYARVGAYASLKKLPSELYKFRTLQVLRSTSSEQNGSNSEFYQIICRENSQVLEILLWTGPWVPTYIHNSNPNYNIKNDKTDQLIHS
jgi:hypothetical protein